jgi:hypothetical protein
MDLKLEFVGFISVLELEWISLLQFIIDLLQDNLWGQSKPGRIRMIYHKKTLSHKARVWPQQIITSARVIKTKSYVDL